jgi:hypothetical protein
MAILKSKFEIGLAGLCQGARGLEFRKELYAALFAESAKNILAVTVTFVNGGSGRAGGFGNGAHSKGFFAASGAQTAGGFQDALFEFGICLSGQRLHSED